GVEMACRAVGARALRTMALLARRAAGQEHIARQLALRRAGMAGEAIDGLVAAVAENAVLEPACLDLRPGIFRQVITTQALLHFMTIAASAWAIEQDALGVLQLETQPRPFLVGHGSHAHAAGKRARGLLYDRDGEETRF